MSALGEKRYRVGVIGFAHMHVNELVDRFIATGRADIVACADSPPRTPSRTTVEGSRAANLQRSLASDERIVTLREQVERSTQLRLQEGVVTASEYLDRSAELLQARFARAGHQVELAQAGARLLTTLGLEVR